MGNFAGSHLIPEGLVSVSRIKESLQFTASARVTWNPRMNSILDSTQLFAREVSCLLDRVQLNAVGSPALRLQKNKIGMSWEGDSTADQKKLKEEQRIDQHQQEDSKLRVIT